MGHYHGVFPENVQQDKSRYICGICGKKKYKKYLKKTIGVNFNWVCTLCISKSKISKEYLYENFKPC